MEKETSSTQEVEIPLAKRERKHSSSGERVEVDMKNGLSTHEVSTRNKQTVTVFANRLYNLIFTRYFRLDGVYVTIFRFTFESSHIFTLLAMLHYDKYFFEVHPKSVQ